MCANSGRFIRLINLFKSQSLKHQILVFFIMAILILAIASSIAVSLQSTRLAVDRSIQQGISITNALAKNSTLALVYLSEDNAEDALVAARAFPGVVQVGISTISAKTMLKQYGDVAPWQSDRYTQQTDGAHLEYENNQYWQFGSIVQVVSGASDSEASPFTVAQPSTEVVGRVHLLISKDELKQLTRSIVIGNFSISLFLCLILFVILRRIISATTEPFAVLANMMQRSQEGEHGLRMLESGSSELCHIANSFNKMMDVLELREKELVLARDAALESSRLKSEFVANVSHEIRTPMNGVLGMLNLLDENMFSPEEKGYISVAKESGQSLLNLINSILDFSKLNAEQVKLEHAPMNLPMLIESTLALHSGSDKQNPLELGMLYDPRVPLIMWGDATRLQQLINNLVSNAIKFTAQGEVRIEVSLHELQTRGALVKIQVKDSGIGITPAFAKKIFEPYSQQDGSISRRFGGTGLGLAICKRLVDLMGGLISVESIEGSGSCFSLILPFEMAEHQDVSNFNAKDYFDQAYLIAPKGLAQDVLVNIAESWQLSYWCIESPQDRQLEELKKHPRQRLVVLINWLQPIDLFFRLLEELKADASVTVVRFYNPLFDRQENLDLIDMHLVKPVRRYELQELIFQRFSKDDGENVNKLPVKMASQDSFDIAILVVEDNIVNQKVAKAHLHKLGLQCDLAANGEEAVRAVMVRAYDLILMDCQMPVMDGYEATKRIRQLEGDVAQVPIIALSANTASEDQERCEAVGMDGFIGKPFTRDQLVKELIKWFPQIAQASGLQKST